MVDIVMPRLSDSMEEGTVLRWLKGVGDAVEVGEELVEIETDKANMVYESDAAGTLIEIVASEGDTLPIGEVIARVGEPGEASSAGNGGGGDSGRGTSAVPAPQASPDPRVHAADAPPEVPSSPAPSSPTPTQQKAAGGDAGDGRIKASPLARRM